MSWDSKLIDRANQIIELYPQKRSALGPLLYLAQNKEGYKSVMYYFFRSFLS